MESVPVKNDESQEKQEDSKDVIEEEKEEPKISKREQKRRQKAADWLVGQIYHFYIFLQMYRCVWKHLPENNYLLFIIKFTWILKFTNDKFNF